jgi:hypothetical protein
LKTGSVSETAAAKLMDFPAFFRHFPECPVPKSVHDSGTQGCRLLFYMKPLKNLVDNVASETRDCYREASF